MCLAWAQVIGQKDKDIVDRLCRDLVVIV